MSIIRIEKSERNKFVVLSNQPLQCPTLSWKAKGLWAYLMSLPENWKVRVNHLAKNFEGGVDLVRSTLNELIKHGLCKREQIRQKGKVICMDYTIYETFQPIDYEEDSDEELKKCLPQPENPGLVLPSLENTPLLIKTKTKKNLEEKREKEKQEKESRAGPSPSSHLPLKLKREEHVFTSEEEHERLAEKVGAQRRDEAYKMLSEWKIVTPKSRWKKDDNLSIHRWVLRAIEEKKLKGRAQKHPDFERNIAIARQAQSQLRSGGVPISKEFFILLTDEVLVRLDTGKRIPLSLNHREFEQLMVETFELTRK